LELTEEERLAAIEVNFISISKKSYKFCIFRILNQMPRTLYADTVVEHFFTLNHAPTLVNHLSLLTHYSQLTCEAMYKTPSRIQELAIRDVGVYMVMGRLFNRCKPQVSKPGV
jgi:hypothetical protein